MGQAADSNRHASLDNQKERAAGRIARTGQRAPGQEEIDDTNGSGADRHAAAGAFGKEGVANRKGGVGTRGGGGGGGESSPAKSGPNDADKH